MSGPQDEEVGGASTISPTPSGLHRADLENFAMGHFARMFFIGIISTAASCSQLAQKDEDRKEMGRQLADAYYSCVRTSFASQRPTMVDRNMAIDQAFTVCKTEERKLQTFENALSESQNGNNSAILAHRNKLREELSR